MRIDYDSYNNMDVKELEKVVAHAKNILNLREQKITNSFINKDLVALKAALEFNSEQKIPHKAWEVLDFSKMKYEDLEFFNYCIKLPKYEQHNNDAFQRISKTNQAIISSFSDEKLFKTFMSNDYFINDIHRLAPEYAVEITTPKEIIKELIDNKILNTDSNLLDKVVNSGKENFLEYFFENKVYNLTKDNYKDLYLRTWNYLNDDLLEIIKENYPEHKDIPLSNLIKPVETHFGKDPDYEKYKKFLKIDQNSFIRALNTHHFEKEIIPHLIRAFNNLAPAENEKFMVFTNFIIDNHPEFVSVFKEQKSLAASGHFKKVYEKVLNYADFQIDLVRNDGISNNRLKL